LRPQRDPRLRRRPVRARAGTRADPVSGVAAPPRHAERRRARRLQRPDDARRPAREPARPAAVADGLSLGDL